VLSSARSSRTSLATLLALLAIALRLLLPALHTHQEARGAVAAAAAGDAAFGSCRCDTFAASQAPLLDLDERQATIAAVDATTSPDHACFACDFELAHPSLPPAPAALLANAAIQLRAPPSGRRHAASAPHWARPPTRAPPRPNASA
jgi:hypothetical protein